MSSTVTENNNPNPKRISSKGLKPPSKVEDGLKLSTSITATTTTSNLKRKAEDQTTTQQSVRPKIESSTTTTTTTVYAKSTATKAAAPSTSTTTTKNPLTRTTISSKHTATTTATVARPTLAAKSTARSTIAAKQTPMPTVTASTSSSSSASAANKKRAGWDFKGRLQDMEEFASDLQTQIKASQKLTTNVHEQLNASEDRVKQLELFRMHLEERYKAKSEESQVFSESNTQLQKKLDELTEEHSAEISKMKRRHAEELDSLRIELESTKRLYDRLQSEFNLLREDNASLRNTVAEKSRSLISSESEIRALKDSLQSSEKLSQQKSDKIFELENQAKQNRETIDYLERKLRADESLRRKLHNTILELKGNIRVFCRVRPPIGEELKDSTTLSHITFEDMDERQIAITQTQESFNGGTSKNYPFTFDKVFGPSSSQSQVFEEISQLVQSALDGYKVCIFAYGQTGSGKTFTMEGPAKGIDDEKVMGMIPRAVNQVFQTAEELKEKGWTYRMEASFLEIYNETIRDLLAPSDSKKYDIKHNPKTGSTTVTDLEVAHVDSPSKVFALLRAASKNRSVGETQMNERSSRSHSVFTLKLIGTNSLTEESCEGVLNLIDLAGSERLSSSGAQGERLKETQAINKSLSSLADVITSLGNKDSHVPYRNSKLTYLLQNSLGGNSKTLMFVNISPLTVNAQETLCSLRFATKVNQCEIGTAKRSTK